MSIKAIGLHTHTPKKTSHQALKIDGVPLIAVIPNKVLIKLIGMNYSVHRLSRLMNWESVDPAPIGGAASCGIKHSAEGAGHKSPRKQGAYRGECNYCSDLL